MLNRSSWQLSWQTFKEALAPYFPDLLLIVCIAISSSRLLEGSERIEDLILSDESYYLYNGLQLTTAGFPTAEWAPIYSVWYGFLSLLNWSRDHIDLYYFNHKLLVGLTAIFLYVALRSLHCSPVISTLVAFIYLISGIPQIWPRPTHFALLLVLILIAIQPYLRTYLNFYYALGVTLLFISFVRPEYFVSFLGVSLLIGLLTWRSLITRSLPLQKALTPQLLIYAGFALLLLAILGIPTSSGNRSWWAFASHYALRWTWEHPSNLNPWSDYEQIARSVFGNADTISEAFQANPTAFLSYVLENIQGFFRNSIAILGGALQDGSPSINDLSPSVNSIVRSLEIAIGLFALIRILMRSRFLIRHSEHKNTVRLLAILMAIELAVLPATFLIFPRYHYLVIQDVLVVILLTYWFVQSFPKFDWNLNIRQACIVGVLLILMTPTLSKGWCVLGDRCLFSRQVFPETPNLSTIQFIRSFNFSRPLNLLAFDIEYRTFLGDSYQRIDPLKKQTSFLQLMQNQSIDLIIQSRELDQDIRFATDPQWTAFLQNYPTFNYQRFDIPNTERRLFVRAALLPAANRDAL